MDYYRKYHKYKIKYQALRGGGVLYNGSSEELQDYQNPPVTAFDEKWKALLSIVKYSDSEIESGIIKGKPYVLELKQGAFSKHLRNRTGYLYTLDRSEFTPDKRLVYTSDKKVRILKTDAIYDIYEELDKTPATLITFDMKNNALNEIIVKIDKSDETTIRKAPGKRMFS